MEFKLPGFKNKKDVTDSSVSFEEKNIALQERMNRIYKFGGIGGMLIGGLSLLALNAALPLKTTVVDAYLQSVKENSQRLCDERYAGDSYQSCD